MRQPPDQNSIAQEARGLINRQESARRFSLERFEPCPELQQLVEHYWLVHWDLTGKPDYLQQNLPHPSQHLVIDPQNGSGLRGVIKRSFQYRLTGKGQVFGVKFRPGAFSAFYPDSMHKLTDRTLALKDFWGEEASQWETMLKERLSAALVRAMDRKLSGMEPNLDEAAREAGQLVRAIEQHPDICSAHQVATYGTVSVRRVQRLFQRYIGVSPKWVIERYRMIEAIEAINNAGSVNLTELSHRLGYFDQAHFSKAFAALVGVPPSQCKSKPPEQSHHR
ncbi:helix-turn-helix domain-containing protein [Marinimicrobium sp. ABcell2]|uniref:AraC family transcriptional regulator n=1 Tax=Marinimicrobium sp. ABcell2 TaxID=3069751 RepID=UPI0027B2F32D|nr:helix-turn-helix domain-containing protein [Marinimicrobium sp. ABcell2]MDQ2077120.1 helix-turn-helix domain-containing protein [Marinimicrobium sp. ABcell2]